MQGYLKLLLFWKEIQESEAIISLLPKSPKKLCHRNLANLIILCFCISKAQFGRQILINQLYQNGCANTNIALISMCIPGSTILPSFAFDSAVCSRKHIYAHTWAGVEASGKHALYSRANSVGQPAQRILVNTYLMCFLSRSSQNPCSLCLMAHREKRAVLFTFFHNHLLAQGTSPSPWSLTQIGQGKGL